MGYRYQAQNTRKDPLYNRLTTGVIVNSAVGSWNLHELLPLNLDFFILLSSLAGIIGSVSQANYAAGNTYQDALVNYRHAKGLPAQSIDLGLMKGIGYVEEHKEVAAHTSSLKLVCYILLLLAWH